MLTLKFTFFRIPDYQKKKKKMMQLENDRMVYPFWVTGMTTPRTLDGDGVA